LNGVTTISIAGVPEGPRRANGDCQEQDCRHASQDPTAWSRFRGCHRTGRLSDGQQQLARRLAAFERTMRISGGGHREQSVDAVNMHPISPASSGPGPRGQRIRGHTNGSDSRAAVGVREFLEISRCCCAIVLFPVGYLRVTVSWSRHLPMRCCSIRNCCARAMNRNAGDADAPMCAVRPAESIVASQSNWSALPSGMRESQLGCANQNIPS
jgi:hypothetical protein